MPVDRESCELLRAIAGPPAGATQQRIDELASNIHDWDSLLRLAGEHRVLPMLYSRLAEVGAAVPAAAQETLHAEHHRNLFHNLANAAELIGLLETLNREGIPAMPFKGVVLGASVYRDPATRPAGDLDVLIRYQDLARATAVMLERGYELKTPVRADGTPAIADYYEYHFERPKDGMVVELRWRLELTQPRFRRNLGLDWVWPRRQTAKLAGAEVPNLSPEITLLVLCMHGSKHAWSRLIWICDVAQLLAAFPALDWNEAKREARDLGLWRTLALGVLLAHRVAGAEVPLVVLRRFESDVSASRLAEHFEEHLFDAPGSRPAGSVPYTLQLLGFRDRLRAMLSRDFWQPNERDRAALHLPKPLSALYYLVRPVRILWDRSAR